MYRSIFFVLLMIGSYVFSQNTHKILLEAEKKLNVYDAQTAKTLCQKIEPSLRPNTPDFYSCYQLLAKSEAVLGNYQTALIYWEKAHKDKNTPEYYKNKILWLIELGDYSKAYEEVYQWQQIEKQRNTADYISAGLLLVKLNMLIGQYATVKPVLDEIKNLTESLYGVQHEVYYEVLSQFALYHKQMNEYKLSESYFMIVLPYYRDENSIAYSIMLSELSAMYMQMGSYERSQEMIQKAEERILTTKYVPLSCFYVVLSQKIDLYHELGKNEISENTLSFLHQKIVQKSHAKHPFYAFTLYRKAKTLYTTAQYIEANEYVEEALQILESQVLPTHNHVHSIKKLQADIAIMLGQYQTAKSILENLLTAQSYQLGYYHPQYLENLQLLSYLYVQENKPDKALKFIEKAYEYAKLNPTLPFLVQKRIYVDYYYLKAMSNFEYYDYSTWENLRQEYKLQNQYSAIADCYTKESEIFLKQKNYDSALKKIHSSLQILNTHTSNNVILLIKNYHLLAQSYKSLVKIDSALYYYENALTRFFMLTQEIFPYMTEHEQFSWYQKIYALLREYQQFVIQSKITHQETHKKMVVFDLYCKSILLRNYQKMTSYAYNTQNQELKTYLEDWQHNKKELVQHFLNPYSNTKSLDSLQKNLIEIERYLRRHIRLEENFDFKLYTWQEIIQSIPDSSALWLNIRVPLSKDSTAYVHYIISTHTPHLRYVAQYNGNEIEEYILPKYKKYIKGVFDMQEEVYQTFWKPIQDNLGEIKKVYYIPDGVYYQVNPNSIYDIEKEQYVLIEYDIYWINHLQDIPSISEKDVLTKPSAILFGYPDYALEKTSQDSTRGTLQPLPGTKIEVEMIKKTLQKEGWKVSVFTEGQASEENLKKITSPTVLHIATHGFYIDKTKNKYLQKRMGMSDSILYSVPLLRSGLMLAGAELTLEKNNKTNTNEEDGILLGYEAQNLNLENTELVTLSACETGLGSIMAGEGIFGLQRAFEMAGVKTIMTSLWNVNDIATQKLMTYFYNFWIAYQDKQKALKMAQIAVMKEYNYPYYWGAFVIVY